MERREGYPNLDLKQSGNLLRYQIRKSGYSVRDIQNYLVLSCPQPVYRWFQGKTLPSVDHLYALSRLLGVHMEDLLAGAAAHWTICPMTNQNICFILLS